MEALYIGRPITKYAQRTIRQLLSNIPSKNLSDKRKRVIVDFCNIDITDLLDENMREERTDEADFSAILDVCRSFVLINVDEQNAKV